MSGRELTVEEIQAQEREGGLFDGKTWLRSPRPFFLSKKEAKGLMKLGHPMAQFQRASDRIYRGSVIGNRPSWIADLLDVGKPQWMVDLARDSALAEVTPRVIRPDLLLTDDGWAVTEIDSLPGGIGVTGWLSRLYGDAGWDILGEKNGMLEGFGEVVPEGARIIVSDESGDYRPEMEWLVEQLGGERSVARAEDERGGEGDIYRFFELFDWENIPAARDLAVLHVAGKLNITPAMKPHLEEKLWLALLKTPSLQSMWRDELRGSHLKTLQSVVPKGWVIDDAELPPHAALPDLNVHSWNDVAAFSQTDRELVVKVSGFSEEAWGSRGVFIGHDLPTDEWKAVIDRAVRESHSQPWIAQEFRPGRVVEHPYYDPETGVIRVMEGRVRVCPYFFVTDTGRTELGGCLATIVPKDKKKIHGMNDGILVPCVISDQD